MSGVMNSSGDRPCCDLLSNLERENVVLGREFLKFRNQEDEYLAKKDKLKEVSAYVYQKLNDLWYSARHMSESDDRRRAITDFVTLTSKAWENDYNKIERDTINDRLTKGDGPLTGLLEKIQCSVTFTEAKFRTSMLWDSACHNKFNTVYNEMMPRLARFSCNYIIQCTTIIIEKTIMVLQTIDENIRRFSETLANFQPSHFNADHAEVVEPQPLLAFSHVVKLLTAELLTPPQAHAMDLRARPDAALTPVRRLMFRPPSPPTPMSIEPKRLPFMPQPLMRALPPQWPPTPTAILPPIPNPFDYPRSETYPPNQGFLPFTRNPPYQYPAQGFNPYIGNPQLSTQSIPPSFGFNNFYGVRNYPPPLPFSGYPSPFDPAWEMDLRARQSELLNGQSLFYARQSLIPEAIVKVDVCTVEEKPPVKGKEVAKRQVPVIRRRRRRKLKTDDDADYLDDEPVVKAPETKERKARKTQTKVEASDLQPIKVPELLSNVMTPLA